MRTLELTVLALCALTAFALIPLDKDQIGKDYAIGRIENLFFPQKTKVIFQSEDRDLFGVLNGETGKLESAYELQPTQRILNFKHWSEIIIGMGKSLNVFIPDIEGYFKMQESYLIEDRKDFNQILGYVRHDHGSTVLTDSFLMRIDLQVFPEGEREDGRNFEIKENIFLKKEDDSESYFSLLQLPNKDNLGYLILVSTVSKESSQQVCFRKITHSKLGPKVEDSNCVTGPKDQTLVDVVGSIQAFYLQFTTTMVSFNDKFEETGRLEQKPVQYYHRMPVVGKKHKLYSGGTGKLVDERPVIENQRFTKDKIIMKVQDEKIEVLDNDKLLVVIAKEKDEQPRKAWSYYDVGISKQHYFFIEFEDGRLVNYLIDEPLSRYEKKWEIKTNQAKKIEDRKKAIALGEKDTRARLRPPVSDDQNPFDNDIPKDALNGTPPSADADPYADEKDKQLPGQNEFPDDQEPIDVPNEDETTSSDQTSPSERQPEDLPDLSQPSNLPDDDKSTQSQHGQKETIAPADTPPAQAPEGEVLPVQRPKPTEASEDDNINQPQVDQQPNQEENLAPQQPPVDNTVEQPQSQQDQQPSSPPPADITEQTPKKQDEKPANEPPKQSGNLAREPEEDLEAGKSAEASDPGL